MRRKKNKILPGTYRAVVTVNGQGMISGRLQQYARHGAMGNHWLEWTDVAGRAFVASSVSKAADEARRLVKIERDKLLDEGTAGSTIVLL